MIFPLAIVAATALSPIMATTLLSFGLVATASTLTRSRKPALIVSEKGSIHDLSERSRLHDELNLKARQETLWYKAEKADWDGMGENRPCFRQQYEDELRLLTPADGEWRGASSGLNGEDGGDARADRWRAVYDALDARQKDTVRRFYSNKLERMACFGPCHKAGV